MSGNGRLDIADVKAAARGQWPSILSAAGIPSEHLDGKHHACPKCGGTDRFRLVDESAGAVLCSQCFSERNGDGLAAVQWILGCGFGKALRFTADLVGVASQNGHSQNGSAVDPLDAVCKAKRMPRESAVAYGARIDKGAVVFPSWGPAGEPMADFSIWPTGTEKQRKGLWPKGGKAGVFLPVVDDKPRLPQSGETWLVVEGPKDAAALHALGFLVLGMNTCKLSQKFASMLRGCRVIFIPDRDTAGINGAESSARKLCGVAAGISIAALPAEVKESEGADTRDILAQENGEQLVREAIEHAAPWEMPAAVEINRPVIKFNIGKSTVADVLAQITNVLKEASDCYIRTGQLVVLRDGHLLTVTKATELAGVLSRHVEFAYVMGDAVNCDPLPAKFGNTWLQNFDELARLPTINVFSRNPMYTQGYRLVAPGFDRDSGIYYAGPAITPKKENTERLDTLLADFCWKSASDRTNYVAVLLTALLMSKFIGSHPAALFNGNQPELGKSILAQIVAILRTGEPAPTCSYNPNDEEFEKSLGSRIKEGATDLIVDNAKDRSGRAAVIDSAVLERSITDHILNYRLLGSSANIRCENSVQFLITANSAECSRDLVTRATGINLHFEGDPMRRTFTMPDPEGYAQEHRLELLAELCGMVERWKDAGMPLAVTTSRFNKKGWGNIVGGILATCGEPDFLANADEMAGEMDAVRREFEELVQAMFNDARGNWSGAELVDLAIRSKVLLGQLGDMSPRSQATRLGKLATRFVGEVFDLDGEKSAKFYRDYVRGGSVYYVRDSSEEDADAS